MSQNRNKIGTHAGFESWLVNIKLRIKMHIYILAFLLFLQVAFFAFLVWLRFNVYELYAAGMWLAAVAVAAFMPEKQIPFNRG